MLQGLIREFIGRNVKVQETVTKKNIFFLKMELWQDNIINSYTYLFFSACEEGGNFLNVPSLQSHVLIWFD